MHRRRFLASLVPVTLGGVAGCVAPESGSTGDDRVVTVAPGERLVAYDRRIGGETLAFDPAGDGLLRGGGSRWRRSDGVAVDGNHRGRHLRPITDRSQVFWRSWKAFYPRTSVYGSDAYEWTGDFD